MKSKSSWTNIEYCEVELQVDWTFHPESKGTRDRYGAPIEPDEPAYLEITKVQTASGDDITGLLTQEQLNDIEDKVRMEMSDEPDYDEYDEAV